MYLFTSLCIVSLIYVLFRFFYKPYYENYKAKKSLKKKEEELFKQQLLDCHPEFIDMYSEFKRDQEEKRKSGYYSEFMISEGGYSTKIYGKYIFVYDQYFEDCFYKKFESKYNEIVNNPRELKKVLELIPQRGNTLNE